MPSHPEPEKNFQLPQAVSDLHACEVGAKHCQGSLSSYQLSTCTQLNFLTGQVSAQAQRSKNETAPSNRKDRKVWFRHIV